MAAPVGSLGTRSRTSLAKSRPHPPPFLVLSNYITKLRRLLEDDPEHPQVLLRDGGGYHVALGAGGASVRGRNSIIAFSPFPQSRKLRPTP